MASAPAPSAPTRRERLRAQTLAEIKGAAREQIAELGAPGLSLNGVARQMGMSGPAIYRYFASRDELLDAVIAELWDDLADALDVVVGESRRKAPPARLRALLDGYRAWALAHPKEYRLMTDEATPDLGDDPGQVPSSSTRSMQLLVQAVIDLAGSPPEGWEEPRDALARSLAGFAASRGLPVPTPVLRLGFLAWTRLHGFCSLDVTGVFATMGVDADALFRSSVDELVDDAAALYAG